MGPMGLPRGPQERRRRSSQGGRGEAWGPPWALKEALVPLGAAKAPLGPPAAPWAHWVGPWSQIFWAPGSHGSHLGITWVKNHLKQRLGRSRALAPCFSQFFSHPGAPGDPMGPQECLEI